MEPIITAKVSFDVKETRGMNRIVSRTVELTGQNEVPIMIVNEKGERINEIPPINPYNLEGVGMGLSPFSYDLIKVNLQFLQEYTDNKIDEIMMTLVEPGIGLSHTVKMIETETDSRIFINEIPAINQDNDPDNDIDFDTFEIKIKYPLPYPQIIQRGESFKKITSDSCEIEYIKKNDKYLNDYNNDGEIQKEEKILLPIWKGPDYSVQDGQKTPYLLSNLVFNKENVKPLSQKQFIPENSKFKIRLRMSEQEMRRINRDTVEIVLKIKKDKKEEEYRIKAQKLKNMFETGHIFLISAKNYDGFYKGKDGNYYYPTQEIGSALIQVIKIDDIDNLNFYQMDIKPDIPTPSQITKSFKNDLFYAMYAYYQGVTKNELGGYTFFNAYDPFMDVVKTVETELEYAAIVDMSPTKESIGEVLKAESGNDRYNHKFKILYFDGHGNYNDNKNYGYLGIFDYFSMEQDTNEIDYTFKYKEHELTAEDIYEMLETKAKDNVNDKRRKIDIVFLNTCNVGQDIEKFKEKLNADVIVAFKTPAVQPYGAYFAKDFFKTLKIKQKENKPVSTWINDVFNLSHKDEFGDPRKYDEINPIEYIYIGGDYIYGNE